MQRALKPAVCSHSQAIGFVLEMESQMAGSGSSGRISSTCFRVYHQHLHLQLTLACLNLPCEAWACGVAYELRYQQRRQVQ